ncbi:hypothetical protein [Rhodobacter sp. 24-YEA-8]|uniref:hypothetical protein n=1 Tax=Rhodobacter sp. 24-YEA-8 TaxID=1884310 RepID=UPI001495D9A7|nr:hypothetical protein [Rhodobacter sp. 24-YEA-8]
MLEPLGKTKKRLSFYLYTPPCRINEQRLKQVLEDKFKLFTRIDGSRLPQGCIRDRCFYNLVKEELIRLIELCAEPVLTTSIIRQAPCGPSASHNRPGTPA